MTDLEELTNELLQDEEFRKTYEALRPEMKETKALMKAEHDQDLHMDDWTAFKEQIRSERPYLAPDLQEIEDLARSWEKGQGDPASGSLSKFSTKP